MEGSLPASVYTIIRTAAHLEPLGFTDPAAVVPRAAAVVKKHHRHQAQQPAPSSKGRSTSSSSNGPGVRRAQGILRYRRYVGSGVASVRLPCLLSSSSSSRRQLLQTAGCRLPATPTVNSRSRVQLPLGMLVAGQVGGCATAATGKSCSR